MSEEIKVPLSIDCWSCGTFMTLDERAENDGDCPRCDSEIDLEDYLAKALAGYAIRDARIAELESVVDQRNGELTSTNRVMCSMALDIVAVGEALSIPVEYQDGGTAEFVEVIDQLRAELAALREQVPAASDYYRSTLHAVLKDIRDEIPRGGLPQSWNDIAEAISETLRHPLYAAPAPAVVMPERKPVPEKYYGSDGRAVNLEVIRAAIVHNDCLDAVARLNVVQAEVKS